MQPDILGPGHHAVRPPVAELAGVLGADVDLPEEFRVICNRSEVQGAADFGMHLLLAIGVRQDDGFSFGIAIGIPGIPALAGQIGVEGVAGMYVQVAEQRLPIWLVCGTGLALFGAFERPWPGISRQGAYREKSGKKEGCGHVCKYFHS